METKMTKSSEADFHRLVKEFEHHANEIRLNVNVLGKLPDGLSREEKNTMFYDLFLEAYTAGRVVGRIDEILDAWEHVSELNKQMRTHFLQIKKEVHAHINRLAVDVDEALKTKEK